MSLLLYEKKGRIAYLTLNRPESRNALSYALMAEMERAWRDFRDDDEVWVAVITGTGAAFSAGLDLKERVAQGSFMTADEQTKTIGMTPSALGIWKPIIAAVNGYAYAAGFVLAMDCDLRVASTEARFAITEVQRGLPALGLDHLARYMTMPLALEMLLTGEPITAQRAYEIGFVNQVVPPDELLPAATALAERIAQNAPLAVRTTKEALYRSQHPSAHELRDARTIMMPALSSEDTLEGMRSFLEKRPPQWKGK